MLTLPSISYAMQKNRKEIVAMRGEMVTAYDSDYKPYLLEATGSEAKHIVDLLNAEREGRLVVLPRKDRGDHLRDNTKTISGGISVKEA